MAVMRQVVAAGTGICMSVALQEPICVSLFEAPDIALGGLPTD